MNDDPQLFEAYLHKANSFRLDKFLFKPQLAFVRDPAPFKTAVCSRRAGKTVSCAAHLIETALTTSNVICLYITITRANAKRIIWPELLRINRQFMLGGRLDNTELSLTLPNGSIIYLSGAKDPSEIEKFRGLAIKICYLDESQSFKQYIKDLIDDVLAPALMDHAGSLCLIGTPGPIPTGYFHDCAVKSDSWSHHAWTFFDNPFIAEKSGLTHRELLDRELKRRGVSVDDPSIQREWFGKWSLDLDSLLLRYDPEKNHFDRLPNAKWEYIMGIDLGYIDADALAVLAWSESEKSTYLVHEVVVNKQGLSELVQQIESLRRTYPISKLVIDEGGLGKKIAEELRRRHHIPVQAADKTRKMENLALLNDALRTARFKAKSDSTFAQDSYLIEIDRDKTTPEKIKIKDSFHSDICMAKGTLVSTRQGERAIETIDMHDWVLTRRGYRRVLWSGCTGIDRPTLRLVFSNGAQIECTEIHPIFTINRGFVAAKDLIHSDEFYIDAACRRERTPQDEGGQRPDEKPVFLMAPNFTDIPIVREPINFISSAFGERGRSLCIEQSGNTILARFLRDLTSTIKTITQIIMTPQIWSYFRSRATCKGIAKKDESDQFRKSSSNTLNASVRSRKNGIKVMRGRSGTASTPKVSLLRMEDGARGDVFNLKVECEPEFFANGILVHNCDAVLYAFRESPAYTYQEPIPKLKVGTREWAQAEEKEMWEQTLERVQQAHDFQEQQDESFLDWG